MSVMYKNGSSWVNLMLQAYPVGALYLSFSSTSPASLFGGSWTAVSGYYLYAGNSTSTGGSNSVTASHSGGYVRLGDYIRNAYEESPEGGYGLPNKYMGLASDLPFADRPIIAVHAKENITNARPPVYGLSNHSITVTPTYQSIYVWRRTA